MQVPDVSGGKVTSFKVSLLTISVSNQQVGTKQHLLRRVFQVVQNFVHDTPIVLLLRQVVAGLQSGSFGTDTRGNIFVDRSRNRSRSSHLVNEPYLHYVCVLKPPLCTAI